MPDTNTHFVLSGLFRFFRLYGFSSAVIPE
jgi:hypothetical protein